MKKGIFSLVFAMLSLSAFAQAPYLGGQADGYASIEGQVGNIVNPPDPNEFVLVYPNRVLQGGEIKIDVLEIKSELNIRLVDVLGQVIFQQRFIGISGRKKILIPTTQMAPAAYWVEVLRDGEKTVKTILILNE